MSLYTLRNEVRNRIAWSDTHREAIRAASDDDCGEVKPKLTCAQKAVLRELAAVGDDDGTSIYPAVGTLADDVGIDRRTCQRILRIFEIVGILVFVDDPNPTEKRRTTLYRLDVAEIMTLGRTETGVKRDERHAKRVKEARRRIRNRQAPQGASDSDISATGGTTPPPPGEDVDNSPEGRHHAAQPFE